MLKTFFIPGIELSMEDRSKLAILEPYCIDLKHVVEHLVHDYSLLDGRIDEDTGMDADGYCEYIGTQLPIWATDPETCTPEQLKSLTLDEWEVARLACEVRVSIEPQVLPFLKIIKSDLNRKGFDLGGMAWESSNEGLRNDFAIIIDVETLDHNPVGALCEEPEQFVLPPHSFI